MSTSKAVESVTEASLEHPEVKLGQWKATAICGNDITSSCLYVSALALTWAGPWAPISLLMVAGVLWLFRGIYAEVVGALPLNGGAYNALLNTTSKRMASVAACLTILSYLATAVISASEAVHYAINAAHTIGLAEQLHHYVFPLTVALLGFFALLTIKGIGESANVALGIFITHMSTLTLLVLLSVVFVATHGLSIFDANWKLPPPRVSEWPILFGFFVAMLGISGFESSSNFVEEQEEGVFPKTLRNMWIAVSFFNPVIALLALAVVPLTLVADHQEALLAHMGLVIGGDSFGNLLSVAISIDAFLVLSGAVLTSFVGVTGLIHRMTLDRCLPQPLLKLSRFNTFHRVILGFFILCALLLYVAKDVQNLAGVYTISFLSVMFLFAVGNGLLKLHRGSLPRNVKVTWLTVVTAGAAVFVGLVGNILLNSFYLKIFLLYFIPALLVILVMLNRTSILKLGIYIVRSISGAIFGAARGLTQLMEKKLEQINSQTVVFFTRGDNVANLNRALLYVRENEHTNRMKIVTVVQAEDEIPPNLSKELEFLDRVYPEIDVEFVALVDTFGPDLLRRLSREWDIPLNFMFIGSPGDRFPHQLAALGGVRLVI